MKLINLQKIDEFLLHEHSCLDESDYCYFIDDYFSIRKVGVEYINQNQTSTNMNNIINNFKKPVDRRGLPEWYYKEQAILQIANWIASLTCWDKIKDATWVPVPPSKIKMDPFYDDRLLQVLQKLNEIKKNSVDIRELLQIRANRIAAHGHGAKRLSPQEHYENYVLDESKKDPFPRAIILFDDVITSGATFKGAQKIITENFPGVPVIGFFVARTRDK